MEDTSWVQPYADDIAKHFKLQIPQLDIRRSPEGVFGCHGETAYDRRGKKRLCWVRLWIGIASRSDVERLIVHELAHVGSFRKDDQGEWVGPHDDQFYNLFWPMARYAKLDLSGVLEDEVGYKPRSALRVAVLHNIPGAVGVSNRLKRKRRATQLGRARKKAQQAQTNGSDQ